MTNLNVKFGVIAGLLLGVVLCGTSGVKPAHTASTHATGTLHSLAVKPVSVPLAQTSTDSATPPAIEAASTPTTVEPPVTTYTHEGLMMAAGISPSDYGAVDYIVSHESSWNQSATEPNTQAHGLVQALPFSKTGCGWDDAVCTLAWGDRYATARYGGWWGAYTYWTINHNW